MVPDFMRAGATLCGLLAAALLSCGAQAQELYVLDGAGEPVLLSAVATEPAGEQPVLFVHGHNGASSDDADLNFRKNWIDGLDGLPSFAQTLRLPANAGLGLEPYFLRLIDQTRSIVDDAGFVRTALAQIQARHGEGTRVVVIGYSKGTLSTRLALKSLIETVEGLPPPEPGTRPVSEFIAISPPNHGLRTFAGVTSAALSVQQMHNGYTPPGPITGLCLPTADSAARDFIEQLNGHPMADSHADAVPLGSYPEEAPGSREPGADPADGTLYVTLYASGNRDFAGGDLPPGAPGNSAIETTDCAAPAKQGRVLARNLAPDAINLSLTGIPGDNPAQVHTNTVHTGNVICQALHTAVHHAPPTAGECATGATAIPLIEPAQRVGVELVLDFSGSMQQPGCPECAVKTEVLVQAASLFIDLWQVVAAPGDHIGVTVFGADARSMRCESGQPCVAVEGNQQWPVDELLVPVRDMVGPVRSFISSQTAAGGTAMGAGLREAIAHLQSYEGMRKRIVVFTDGMQNVPPQVAYQPADCADGNCPLVIADAAPIALDASLGIPVDTIGVGVGDAWLGLLSELSLATGGVSRATISPDDDLAAFFTDSIVDALQGFSPQRVARQRGTIAETPASHRFEVNANVRRVMLTLRGDVTASVARDEQDITEQGRMISRAGYQLWTIAVPPGPASVWTVTLSGNPAARYDISLLVDEPELAFNVSAGRRHYKVGDSLQLEATVTINGAVIQAPVDVNVRIERPGDSAANVLASQARLIPSVATGSEPKEALAQTNLARLLRVRELYEQLLTTDQTQPMTPDDRGRYTGQSAPLTVPGSRLLEFVVSGEHPRLGRFQRSRSVSVMVEVGAASPKVSTLRAQRERDNKNVARWGVLVTPRDEAGNHLGPGFAARVRVQLDGGAQRPAEDLGNGSYRVLLDPGAILASPLRVAVAGVPVFEGVVGDIAPPPTVTPRDPWQYGLALALVLFVLWWFRRVLRPTASRNGRRR